MHFFFIFFVVVVFGFDLGFGLCVFGSGILQFGLMGSDICIVNGLGTHEWRKGWPLRSGGFAQLL